MTPTTENSNLYEAFRSAFPADTAMRLMTLGNGRVIAYGDFDRQSTAIARKIIEAGSKPGDQLMMQMAKTPEAIALYLACVRAGVVFIPLNTEYGPDELEYLAGDAKSKVIVCDPSSPFTAKDFPFPSPCAVLTLDEDGNGSLTDTQPSTNFQSATSGGNDVAAILYTSGTTGKPKGAMLTQNNLRSNAAALIKCWGINCEDVLLHALPVFHTHGLFVAVNMTLLSGSQMIFLKKFDVDQMLERLKKATTMMSIPTFYTWLLVDDRLTENPCSTIRLFVSGSPPLMAKTLADFRTRNGHTILERYGITETNMIASNPLTEERRAVSVGYSLLEVTVRIASDQGNEFPKGEIGGIEVTGPNVFRSYWQNPEKTKTEFRDDGFFITGDVGRIDADGYLNIIGRSKDLIISGAFNVYPKEIEEVIDAMDGVVESAVIGVPHKDFGEGVTAIVVSTGADLSPDEIKPHCRSQLAPFKSPKAVVLVDTLPRNTMGKVEKAKHRTAYSDLFAG